MYSYLHEPNMFSPTKSLSIYYEIMRNKLPDIKMLFKIIYYVIIFTFTILPN